MPAVRLSRISFHYEDPIEVLTDLNLHLDTGWTGVVGENGCGKTTLLSILSGRLVADAGQVECVPADSTRLLCRQRVSELDDDVAAFGNSWERGACRLRARLGMDEQQLSRWSTLSPGERKRWQVGAALWRRPDVLLLDEPTNHIDASARALLVDALQRFRGVGVVVSHDRLLLDELCQRIVRIDRGIATVYRGNYSSACAQWQAERTQLQQAHAAARQQQRTLDRRIASVRRQRAEAEAKIAASSRIKGPRDSDARSINVKGRVKNAEAKLSRKVHVLRGQTERATNDVARLEVHRQRGRSLFVDYVPAPMPRLISLERADVSAGDTVVLRDVTVALERTSRVHIAGDNGAGKTSLLRALLDAAGERGKRMLYLPQEIDGAFAEQLRADIQGSEQAVRERVLSIAAALGLDPSRALGSSNPSPGELRKLMMAWGLGSSVWAVLVDEPTNHLDLPSIERLEYALAGYPGALLMVTHDATLAAAATNETWTVREGGVVVD